MWLSGYQVYSASGGECVAVWISGVFSKLRQVCDSRDARCIQQVEVSVWHWDTRCIQQVEVSVWLSGCQLYSASGGECVAVGMPGVFSKLR